MTILRMQEQMHILEGKISSRIGVDLHESTIQNLNNQISNLENEVERHKSELMNRSANQSSQNKYGGNNVMNKYKFPFELDDRNCLLHLGGCTKIGCDGAVWLSTAFCSDGYTQEVAVKFHKTKEERFMNGTAVNVFLEKRLPHWDQLTELFTTTMAYVYVPLWAMSETTGECKVKFYLK
eukprot:UN22474